MLTGKITVKGQVTIPKEVRESMGIGPSDSVYFTPLGQGKALIATRNRPASALFGMLKQRGRKCGKPLSIEEIEAVIKRQRLEAGLAGMKK
ncbi:MAG: AbrB/MazE/SpoVT family DNA-binding domain-containing protein [Thermodesulfobacteriota bacterium]|nr:AbrB/MazE/SpoVT family DNA-binding domain-containing protein [Thermodesulfobacteriota bacterium]